MLMLPSSYQQKAVGVFGLGKSGNATLLSLAESGAVAYGWDDKEESRNAAPKHNNIHILPADAWPWDGMKAMIHSPGIPFTHPAPHPVVLRAQAAGVQVTGDVALLCEASPLARFVGITGTNGKSTTTSLVGHIFAHAGQPIQVGGNLGTPVLSFDALGRDGTYILELSSYQLDLNPVRMHIAALLNITPDHLDRHGGMEGYIAAKEKIFARQQAGDVAIIAVDDAHTEAMCSRLRARAQARVVPVCVGRVLAEAVYVIDGILYDATEANKTITITIGNIASLTGRHNWQNAAVAYAIAKAAGISLEIIEEALRSFPGLRHRMQLAATVRGVRFINDSKATNAEATENALRAYDKIYWIVGGQSKAGGISSLEEYFPKIVHAYLIGEASKEFAATLSGKVAYTESETLERALAAAAKQAFDDNKKDAVVLLSPACASWDQWKSFEHRGDAFCEMAAALRQ